MNTLPISKEDYEKERTVTEMIKWREDILNKINADKNEKKVCRIKKGIYKEFIEEFLPVSYWAEAVVDRNRKISLKKGDQNYDGILKKSCLRKYYIEVSQVIDGYKDKGISGFINRDGHAPASTDLGGKALKNILKEGGQIVTGTINSESVIGELVKGIKEVIDTKASKNYPKNTILLISMFDWFFTDKIKKEVIPQFKNLKVKFKEVFIIGGNRDRVYKIH